MCMFLNFTQSTTTTRFSVINHALQYKLVHNKHKYKLHWSHVTYTWFCSAFSCIDILLFHLFVLVIVSSLWEKNSCIAPDSMNDPREYSLNRSVPNFNPEPYILLVYSTLNMHHVYCGVRFTGGLAKTSIRHGLVITHIGTYAMLIIISVHRFISKKGFWEGIQGHMVTISHIQVSLCVVYLHTPFAHAKDA